MITPLWTAVRCQPLPPGDGQRRCRYPEIVYLPYHGLRAPTFMSYDRYRPPVPEICKHLIVVMQNSWEVINNGAFYC